MIKKLSEQYPKVTSAVHTFIATFIVSIVGTIALIPADSILSADTWTIAALVGIISAGVRAAVKASFAMFFE